MNVVISVSNGYPVKFNANNTKGELMALGLKKSGCSVSMVDLMAGQTGLEFSKEGVSQKGIPYILMPRKYAIASSITNLWIFYKYLKKVKRSDNYLILTLGHYPIFILMSCIAHLIGYKVITLFHEWPVAIEKGIFRGFETRLRVNTFGYFVDSILPISHVLKDWSAKFHKPVFLLPVLSIYPLKSAINSYSNINFSICIGAKYVLRNDLILRSFKGIVKEYNDAQLTIVTFGNKADIDSVKNILMKIGIVQSVNLLIQIPQDELYKIYARSTALLIPLDPSNFQDKTRFSQKIAEYLASRRPIITSNVGEIPYYFNDKKDAVIVPYTINGYYNGMKFVIENKEKADEIGNEGFLTGKRCFSYDEIMKKLSDFMRTI